MSFMGSYDEFHWELGWLSFRERGSTLIEICCLQVHLLERTRHPAGIYSTGRSTLQGIHKRGM